MKVLKNGGRELDGHILKDLLQGEVVDEVDAVTLKGRQLLIEERMHGRPNGDTRVARRRAVTLRPLANVEEPVKGGGTGAQVAEQLDNLLLLGECQGLNLVDVAHQAVVLAVLVKDEDDVLLQGHRLEDFQRQQGHIRGKLALAATGKKR